MFDLPTVLCYFYNVQDSIRLSPLASAQTRYYRNNGVLEHDDQLVQ